jgi:hypothetical protein
MPLKHSKSSNADAFSEIVFAKPSGVLPKAPALGDTLHQNTPNPRRGSPTRSGAVSRPKDRGGFAFRAEAL